MICTRTTIYSLISNEASYLEYFAPMVIFSIYSIELELHDRKSVLHAYVRV
jgi:hypothetical protein